MKVEYLPPVKWISPEIGLELAGLGTDPPRRGGARRKPAAPRPIGRRPTPAPPGRTLPPVRGFAGLSFDYTASVTAGQFANPSEQLQKAIDYLNSLPGPRYQNVSGRLEFGQSTIFSWFGGGAPATAYITGVNRLDRSGGDADVRNDVTDALRRFGIVPNNPQIRTYDAGGAPNPSPIFAPPPPPQGRPTAPTTGGSGGGGGGGGFNLPDAPRATLLAFLSNATGLPEWAILTIGVGGVALFVLPALIPKPSVRLR
jgi:hypothetical protein